MCRNCLPKKPKKPKIQFKPGGPLANIGPIPDRETDSISLRIYVKDGKVETVVPESPWEGQVDVQVIYRTDYVNFISDRNSKKVCKEEECPEGPELHRHDWMSVGVFRAERK